MNRYINTIIIAPLTTREKKYPTRHSITFEDKLAWVALDQIRCIDKIRLVQKAGSVSEEEISSIKCIIKEMLVD